MLGCQASYASLAKEILDLTGGGLSTGVPSTVWETSIECQAGLALSVLGIRRADQQMKISVSL